MTENPAAFLVDFGVSMTFGAVTDKVIFDESNEPAQFGGFGGSNISITYDPAKFTDLDVGSRVLVNSRPFEVMSPPEGDSLMSCTLKKVSL